MRLSINELRRLITEELVLHERRQIYDEVVLSTGTNTSYGSEDHLADMSSMLGGLETLRNQCRFGTANRAVYASALRQLKTQIKRAELSLASASAVVDTMASEVVDELEPELDGDVVDLVHIDNPVIDIVPTSEGCRRTLRSVCKI